MNDVIKPCPFCGAEWEQHGMTITHPSRPECIFMVMRGMEWGEMLEVYRRRCIDALNRRAEASKPAPDLLTGSDGGDRS